MPVDRSSWSVGTKARVSLFLYAGPTGESSLEMRQDFGPYKSHHKDWRKDDRTGCVMGYRNEIYRAKAAEMPSVKTPPETPVGSFCVPASPQDWQARGWAVLDGLNTAENAATRPNPADSSILGLSYSFQNCHESGFEKIMLRIDSWRHDKFGDTTDLPIMEIIFDATQFQTPARALESLKLMARPVKFTEKVASRTVSAALFLINQINAGQVPDFERVLELHRIHPDLNRESGKTNGKKMIRARVMSGSVSAKASRNLTRGFDGERSEKS
jgi:hypothetical protein